jgi:AraC-like DNA-binding protein
MDARVIWAIDEMNHRIAEPLRVAELANGVRLSPSRFAHLFRAETGSAPGEFLHTLRMREARTLLEGTFLSIKEVGTMVGCNDASHFARDFRRFHGMGPRELRMSGGAPLPDPSAARTATISVAAGYADEQQDRLHSFPLSASRGVDREVHYDERYTRAERRAERDLPRNLRIGGPLPFRAALLRARD